MTRFLFSTKTSTGTDTLYATDGTAAGTGLVNLPGFQTLGASGGGSPDFTTFNGRDYFLGAGFASKSPLETRIYSTDGAASGTPGTEITGLGGVASPAGLWVVNGHLLTSGQTAGGVPGLWSSTDGVTFSEIRIGYGTSKISVSHGAGFFATDLNTGSAGVWRTDGTLAGTQQIALNPGLAHPSNFLQVANGNTVFFDDGLWVTDGVSNTYEIINFTLGTHIDTASAASTGTRAIFAALDDNGLESVWSTDGTGPGTTELLTNPRSDRSPVPSGFTAFGNKVVFTSGFALYATDGTVAGTVNLSGVNVEAFGAAGSNVFFTDYRSPSGIFVSDGTAAGTREITVPGLQSANAIASITAVGSSVVFEGTDATGKAAFFTSDGTAAGTGEITLPAGVVPSATSVIAPLPASAASGIVTLGGGAQDYAAAAGTTVQAGSGSDTISARAGQVTVLGSSGRLVFFGGSGSSVVNGAAGSDTVFGGVGGGQFTGGASGHNILIAQGGNTTLTGAAGGDQVFGAGAGNDVLNLGTGRELVLGGGGNTTVNGGSGSSVIFSGGGTTSVVGGTGGGDTIVGGAGILRVTAQHGDAIFGGSGALTVNGSAGGSHADSVIGGSGALTVAGHGANMLVVGGTTASNVFTGDGASLIFSGSGSTSVTGGAGSMQVVLGSGGGTFREGAGPSVYDAVKGSVGGLDVITGFRPGTDKVALFGYAPGDVQVLHGGGSTVLDLAGGARIELLGVADPGHGVTGV